MMFLKKAILQLTVAKQAKSILKYLFPTLKLWSTQPYFTRYEECSDHDKKYLIAYDTMLGELTAIRMYDYNRYKKVFVEHLTSSDKAYSEAARELLNEEFLDDKEDIDKLLILK